MLLFDKCNFYFLNKILLFGYFFLYSVNCYCQQFQWAKQLGGAPDPTSIGTDSSGNIYVSGYFWSNVDFDPSPSVYPLNAALSDGFIDKFDSFGNFLWARQIKGSSYDFLSSMCVDAIGNVFVTGYFQADASFDSTGTHDFTTHGLSDIFIAKYDPNGNVLWAKQIGGNDFDGSYSMAIDESGNIFISGHFVNTVDFDPNSGVYNLVSTTSSFFDGFILKLTNDGNFVWVKQLKGTGNTHVFSIDLDSSANILLTGSFHLTTDFDPGISAFNMTATGPLYNVFIEKIDSSGNFIWAKKLQLGNLSSGDDFETHITSNIDGTVYVNGSFNLPLDFDPGPGNYTLTPVGLDLFVLKLNGSGDFDWVKRIGAANIIANTICNDKFGNIYSTGFFQSTVDFDPGPNVLNLTFTYPDTYILKLDSNGNFAYAKQMHAEYSSSKAFSVDNQLNTYTTGRYQLTGDFNPGTGEFIMPTTSVDMFIQKSSYCESNQTTDTVTACDSYTWINGITYSSSNSTAKVYLSDSLGCDSIVSLNLTINEVDNSITIGDTSLISNQVGASYQWLNCDSGYTVIIGDTNQTITPISNGNYAVQIIHNGCVDTSSCYLVTVDGITNLTFKNNFRIFPNPTNGYSYIYSPTETIPYSLIIRNTLGQIVYTILNETRTIAPVYLGGSNGIYFLEIQRSGLSSENLMIIKN